METAIQTVETSPQTFITQAIEKGLSVEHLERLMALQERWNAGRAKMEFIEAMKGFQSECPVIEKKKKVFEKGSTTKARYQYAPLDHIIEQVKGLIANHGLSYSFRTTNDEKNITATLRITHIGGHSEENSFIVPIGSESYMSDVQKYGARRTFAERYAFCDGFGILTGDEDTDATKETIQQEAPEGKKTEVQEAVVVENKKADFFDDVEKRNSAISKIHGARDVSTIEKIETYAHKLLNEGIITEETFKEIGVEITKKLFELQPNGETK